MLSVSIAELRLLRPPALVYGGTAVVALVLALRGPPRALLSGLCAGLLLYTLLEYLWHRFVNHHPRAQDHREHHVAPNDLSTLVIPLRQSAPPFAVVLALVFVACRDVALGASVSVGILTGYLAYECIHLATHLEAMRLRYPWLEPLTRGHARHHLVDGRRDFGFVTTLWDWVFGTRGRIS